MYSENKLQLAEKIVLLEKARKMIVFIYDQFE